MKKATCIQAFCRFWSSPRHIILVGGVLVLAASLIELLRGRAENFMVFRDATRLFWQDISPYTEDFVLAHERYYLYSPVFPLLFAPFAYLPRVLGGVVWNLMGYGLLCGAIMLLPTVAENKKAPMLLWLLLFMGQTAFCFQYNMLITCFFLLAYILLEKGEAFWAMGLIMLSATTKIYGIVELALLLCYPKFWRNLGYALLWGAVLVVLPMVQTGWDGLMGWYGDWWEALSRHTNPDGLFYSIVFAQPTRSFVLPHMRAIQAGAIGVLAILFFACHKIWQQTDFKIGVLATVMIYIVLFSEAAEFTSYTIAATGLALWYSSLERPNRFQQILWWSIFVLFGVMPIDLFCPVVITRHVHTHLWLGVWVFVLTWLHIIHTTIRPAFASSIRSNE